MFENSSITICILTFRRPEGLRRLLSSISRMRGLKSVSLDLLVVDNEGSVATAEACHAWSRSSRITLRYIYESKRGISFARNRALNELSQTTEYVAFIDDDEIVEEMWLMEMMSGVCRFPEACVWNGPVVSSYPPDTAKWVTRGGFLDRPENEDGAIRHTANTGNVLFRRKILDLVKPWFDPDLALSGGEDANFFERVHHAGLVIVWVRSAVVTEFVEPRRATARWILQRHFRYSNSRYFISQKEGRGRSFWWKVGLVSVGRCIKALLLSPMLLTAPVRFEWAMRPMITFARGVGGLHAVLGKHYLEYK